jgi:YbbR domain-containing protein
VLVVFISWLIINAREGEITNTNVPVKFYNLSQDFLLTKSSPDEIEVQLRSFSGLIPAPKENEIAANIDLSKIKEGNNIITIKKEDFKLPPGVVVTRVRPSTLRVSIGKKARKWLRVEPKITGRLPGKLKIRKINIEPSSVLVEGSENMLSRLEDIETEEIDLSGIQQSAIIEKKLVSPATQLRVIWDGNVKIHVITSR